eukprot:959980-Amphidinium_carterae.1
MSVHLRMVSGIPLISIPRGAMTLKTESIEGDKILPSQLADHTLKPQDRKGFQSEYVENGGVFQ